MGKNGWLVYNSGGMRVSLPAHARTQPGQADPASPRGRDGSRPLHAVLHRAKFIGPGLRQVLEACELELPARG